MTSTISTTRDAIIEATADLLSKGGRDAVSTRAVAKAANVQAPTIYRHFGDMHGLLDAVISYELGLYLQRREAETMTDDPVDALRAGWHCNVRFGLSYPAFYTLMYGDARPGAPFTAVAQTVTFFHELVQRVAEAGRLRINVAHATQMVHAACCGVTLTLLTQPVDERDDTLSAMMREAILGAMLLPLETPLADAAITTPHGAPNRVASRAVALQAVLTEVTNLTSCERGLLGEWLDRLSND